MDLETPAGMKWVRLIDPDFGTSRTFVGLHGGRYGRRTTGSVFLVVDGDAVDPRLAPAAWQKHEPKPRRVRPPCVHRGDVVDHRLCTGCNGAAKLMEVYTCDLHGKCADRTVRRSKHDNRRDKAIVVCLTCGDYESAMV